ncbi:M48 metallopeptidase family protein [Halopseudomonas litoralis]|uniref:M48 metallopeptidase family protein n=1 Tax=Halopseudomonas litoralis TaxID=797277 RepID=UPI000B7E0B05|nr:YgjP-like metallopeptidase domain-containing protein [Halopseudomonas litoralis]
MTVLRYLNGYGPEVKQQVQQLIDNDQLGVWLQRRYPPDSGHAIQTDVALYDYTQRLKQQYMRSSGPISKVFFDTRMHVIDNALGQHQFVSRVQGNKLKRKNEIKVSALLKTLPEALLRMVVVHELAHLREKEHNKAFYQLCQHMQSDYHQLELDLRLFLTFREINGDK